MPSEERFSDFNSKTVLHLRLASLKPPTWSLGVQMFRVLAILLAFATSPALATSLEDPPPFLLKWGSPGSGPGQFSEASGMGIDASGNIYVADRGNDRIQKFSGDGAFLGSWGSDGFTRPSDVAVSHATGEIFVTDPGRAVVLVFDSNFTFLRQLLLVAQSISIDPSGTFLYGTSWPGDLSKYQASDGVLLDQWTYTLEQGYKEYGFAVAPSGYIYIGDTVNDRVCALFSPTGCWGSSGSVAGTFTSPGPVAINGAETVVYVADLWRVQKFTTVTEQFLTSWGGTGTGDGQFANVPDDIAVDAAGNVFVLDTSQERIQKFGVTPTPVSKTTWGRLKLLYR